MNTKIVLGVVVVALVVGIGFLATRPHLQPALAPTPPTSTSTEALVPPAPAKSPKTPAFTFGTTTSQPVRALAQFDSALFVSTSSNPVVSGTANVPKVGIVIYNSAGRGLVGTADISVQNGHWWYKSSVALSPDTYTIHLIGGDVEVTTKLVVKNP